MDRIHVLSGVAFATIALAVCLGVGVSLNVAACWSLGTFVLGWLMSEWQSESVRINPPPPFPIVDEYTIGQ